MILQRTRKAMTLIELIITMSILATIAAIAVISADDLGENSRYDETDRRGKLIQNALVGYDTPRFIQDMGRAPVLLVDINQSGLSDDEILTRKKLFLAELVDLEADSTLTYNYENAQRMKKQECTITTYFGAYKEAGSTEISSTILPSEVTIKAGWAGPYALSGSENMTDNWGKPWDIYHYGDDDIATEYVLKWATKLDDETFDDTNDDLERGTEIYGVRSIYKEDYASDLSYIFPEDCIYTDLKIKLCDSSGNEINPENYDEIRVFLYLPYCEPKNTEYGNATSSEANYPNPKIMELCLWYDSTTSKGLKIRYDANNNGTVAADETLRFTDADTDSDYPTYLKARFNADETSNIQVALDSVPVGSRKVWAYANKSTTNTVIDSSSSGIYAPLQNIKITATNNTIELRLNQTF